MTIPRWTPSSEVTKREAFLLKRLQRTKKLFRFLREHRLDLFDTAFQDELASMYRDSDEGTRGERRSGPRHHGLTET